MSLHFNLGEICYAVALDRCCFQYDCVLNVFNYIHISSVLKSTSSICLCQIVSYVCVVFLVLTPAKYLRQRLIELIIV